MSILNVCQQEAVDSDARRLLVIAGAGSGKTKVIVAKITSLVKKKLVNSRSILAITFTNKAVDHMKGRLDKVLGVDHGVNVCTFHSYCLYYLRSNIGTIGYASNFSLYSEYETKRVLEKLAVQVALELDMDESLAIAQCYKLYADRRSGCMIDDTFEDNVFLKTLWDRFQVAMRVYNAVDFNSLIELTVRIWKTFPDLLDQQRQVVRYIFVDEFQDTDPLQEQLISMLTGESNCLCVVGDDDQSIYEWRGACVKHILDFKHDHIIKLEENYRSTQNILECANSVIANNTARHVKRLRSCLDIGERVEVFYAPDEKQEAASVVRRMMALKSVFNLPWSSFAILFRSNLLASVFESELICQVWQHKSGNMCRGVPYRVFGGTSLYDFREAKDICAYMSCIVNTKDQMAILRCINEPNRGIGELSLEKLLEMQKKSGRSLFDILNDEEITSHISARAMSGIRKFIDIVYRGLEFLENSDLAGFIPWILETTNYSTVNIETIKNEKVRKKKQEILNDLILSFKSFYEGYQDKSNKLALVSDFVAATNLNLNQFKGENKHGDFVTISTFHAVKGLEFPVCFITCAEENIIPHKRSVDEGKIEEERRLMYVAMTRAMRYLCISMSAKRTRFGKKDVPSKPSRFLYEIDKKILNMTHWDRDPDYEQLFNFHFTV